MNSRVAACRAHAVLVCVAILGLVAGTSCFATEEPPTVVYYVDFAAGADTNDGLTRENAWKHLPGTRQDRTFLSTYVTTTFGKGAVVAGSKRIPPGAVLRLKGGTVQDARVGGSVLVNPDWYQGGTPEKPIIIERDATWGEGPVVFDGAKVALGKWDVQFEITRVDNVWLRGNGKAGITLKDSPRGALALWGSDERKCKGLKVSDVLISGFHDAGFGAARLDGYEITGVELDGKSIAGNYGFHFGEWSCNNGLFRRCISHNLGDEPGAQSGGTDIQIGFVLLNSRNVTYQDCTAYDNEGDGFDMGLERATEDNCTDNIRYINCLSYNNADGFGMNAAEDLKHCMRVYCINCISYNNNFGGFHAYGGTAEYIYTHVLSQGNRDANFNLGPDGWDDKTATTVRIYNSVGYKPDPKPYHKASILTHYIKGMHFRLDSDYNYWGFGDLTKDRNFCLWDGYAGKAPYVTSYSYADGPGSTTTNWYKLDEDGHLNCDGHSLNMALGPLPAFADEPAHDYHLTPASALRGKGVDLRSKPWYLPEMGVDRDGKKREAWSIGPYE